MNTLTRERGWAVSARYGWDATWWLLIGILLLAALLRLRGLNLVFEQDEIYTLSEATKLFGHEARVAKRPLYLLLQHLLLQVWPATPITLRMLPFLFGLLGVWATWVLARRLSGTTAAVVSSFLVAISPWHMHESTMARYWSLVYLLATLFYLALARAASTHRARDYLYALAVALAGSATHPTFLFAAGGAAVGALFVSDEGRLSLPWPSRTAWLFFWGPWIGVLFGAFLTLKLIGQEEFRLGSRGFAATVRLAPAMIQWMTPVVFAAGMLGAVVLLTFTIRPHLRRWGAMSLAGTIATLSLLTAASVFMGTWSDYGIAMLPLLLVSGGALIGLAVERTDPRAGPVVTIVATLVIAAGVAPSTFSHIVDGTRFDYRPALREIGDIAPQLPVLSWPEVVERHYAPTLDVRPLMMNPEVLDSTLHALGDMWVILSVREYGAVMDPDGRGEAWIAAHCHRQSQHQRFRLDSRSYRVNLYRCRSTHSEREEHPGTLASIGIFRSHRFVSATTQRAPGMYPNQPPGYSPILEHSFAIMPPDERYPHDCPGGAAVGCVAKYETRLPWTIVNDPNAPQSPPGVLRLNWPSTIPESGDRAGVWYGWDNIEHAGDETEMAEIYVSFWFRIPTPDFEHPGYGGIKPFGFISVGHPAWTNALYLTTNLDAPQQVVTELSGFNLIIQNHLDWRRQPNVADLPLSCGVWHHVEQVLVLNDIGLANGAYKLWFDQQPLFDLGNVEYRTPEAPHGFNHIWWDPIWGGGTGDKVRDDYTDIDHVYVSGIPLP